MAAAEPAAAPGERRATDPKLVALRELFAKADGGQGISAFIIPSEDPHMSEYPPACDYRRAYITGFDGSYGTAVVTADAALLWTDGRYFLQAEQQLGPDWTLMKAGTSGCPEIQDWLASNLPEGARVGIDPFLHTVDVAEKLQRRMAAAGKELVPLANNLVDEIWTDRPAPPKEPLRVHPLEWAGKPAGEKLGEVRKQMEEAGAGALLVTMLDEVAWLLNLRGADVAYNPVFLSYALVTADGAALYVDPAKVGPPAAAALAEAGVEVKAYEQLLADVKTLASSGVKLWMDPARVSYALKRAALAAAGVGGTENAAGGNGAAARKRPRAEGGGGDAGAAPKLPTAKDVMLEKTSPVVIAKAVKNEAEMAGLREAHLRDGVALVQFLCWVEKAVAAGRVLTEVEVDEELTARRRAQPGFVELSFPTIAGSGPNGAIIHYRAEPETCATVDGSSLLLLDSGGQYDCGTTDITRTMHFGQPTEHQKACYTRVLQGHIGLDTAVFPEGTPGCAIDVLARVPLWSMGLNYRHGTGHGVGAALNVHEGPHSISSRFYNTQPLLQGMVCSNEPGYYEDGAFGIRIENLVVIEEAETLHQFGGKYFRFSPLTVCPIQKKLVARELLTPAQAAWLDGYHRRVWEALSPRLEGQAEELEWLRQATAPL